MEEGACLVMKNIGKPCTGKPYARFDEGGQASMTTVKLLRHGQKKGAVTDRFNLRVCVACFLLYPYAVTLWISGMERPDPEIWDKCGIWSCVTVTRIP